MAVARGPSDDPGAAAAPPLVFVSYSRKDADWVSRFATMLRPLVRNRRMELWVDRDAIETGELWRARLDDAIARSDVALLLVTPDFLASDFIVEQELPALVRAGVTLAPVLVRPCLHELAQLGHVQWARDLGAGPLRGADDEEREIVEVCRRVMRLVAARAPAEAEPAREGPAPDVGDAPALRGAGRGPGRLHGVPSAPAGFVERAELGALRDALLGAGTGSVAITGGRAMGLHGQGGIGKTVLAGALARDPAVRAAFPDGVFWVAVGEHPDLVARQIELLYTVYNRDEDRSGDDIGEFVSGPRDARSRLRSVVRGLRCLIVVDDVWSAAAAEAFDVTGPEGRVLYTTRDPGVLRAVGARVREIGVLPKATARRLLATLADTPVARLPREPVDRVLDATGRVALALALVGAAVGRGGRSWPQVADRLEDAGATFLDHPYANTFKALSVATEALGPELRRLYEALVAFGEDTRVPVEAVARLWAGRGVGAERTPALLEELAAAELLAVDAGEFTFHDLQREFLLLHCDSVRLAHAELLDAYRALLPARDSPWRRLPRDEPYIRDHLLEHLVGAGETSASRTLASDLGWHAIRAFEDGPHAAESDARRAAALAPDDRAVAWALGRVSRWGHLLAGHARLDDLAATLWTRTTDPPAGVDRDALRELLASGSLTPRWGLPDADPALRRVLEGHADGVSAVAFSPDGRTLASASDEETVRLWDTATNTPRCVLKGRPSGVNAVAFSPNGCTLATASLDETVRLWDTATGTPKRVLEGHEAWVQAVAFSPDGRTLASASDDGTVRLWDTATGAPKRVLKGHAVRVQAVAFSPDSRTLASASDDRTVRLWNTATGTPDRILEGHADWVRAVAFSPDGRTLASASDDGTVRLWDTATGPPDRILEGHADGVRAVAFSPDGRSLASAYDDGTVRLWDIATGTPHRVLKGHPGRVNAVAFSPEGRTLASASDDRTVRLWNTATGTLRRVLKGHADRVQAVAFSPDGRMLASACNDRTVRLWNTATGTPHRVLKGHAHWVRAVAFSPDGRTLVSASNDRTARVWDAATGTPEHVLKGHAARVSAVAFNPDGRTLASASDARMVRVWDAATGTPEHVLKAHAAGVTAIAFSCDGRTLASASNDETVRLWDTATGTCRLCVRFGDAVGALAMTDGAVAIALGQAVCYLLIADPLGDAGASRG